MSKKSLPFWGHQDFCQAKRFERHISRWFTWESVIAMVQTT